MSCLYISFFYHSFLILDFYIFISVVFIFVVLFNCCVPLKVAFGELYTFNKITKYTTLRDNGNVIKGLGMEYQQWISVDSGILLEACFGHSVIFLYTMG